MLLDTLVDSAQYMLRSSNYVKWQKQSVERCAPDIHC